MVFSAVIIRVTVDGAHGTTTSNLPTNSGFGFSRVTRRSGHLSTRAMTSSNANGITSHLRSDGVQITLDRVTHTDPSEFEMDKMETGSAPYDHPEPKGELQ